MKELINRLHENEALAQLVGHSPVFIGSISCIPAIAKGDASTLITGETGTGKELVARAIHYLSSRSDFPFVALNCASLPDTLVEEELFGHERGAFTGADNRRRGLVAEAHKGTLFLDEINAMPEKAQATLLRVLQERTLRPIGSNVEHPVDIRVVAASNEPIEKLASSVRFRKDLYYRLCVFSVRLPPLRQRKQDIDLLVQHFLAKHGAGHLRLSPAAEAALQSHDWPGNVRELENCLIRAMHLCQRDWIEAPDLFEAVNSQFEARSDAGPKPFKYAKQRVVESLRGVI